jgi:hypothetical protein|eukprot:2752663-Prymnesium_polylepis.2
MHEQAELDRCFVESWYPILVNGEKTEEDEYQNTKDDSRRDQAICNVRAFLADAILEIMYRGVIVFRANLPSVR